MAQWTSHDEGSPTKKTHTMAPGPADAIPAAERGLLFGARAPSRAANRAVVMEVSIPITGTKPKAAAVRTRSFKRERSESSLDGLEDGFGVATLADPVEVLA